MKKRLPVFPIVAFMLAFLIACAQVVAPTGGEKDIIPPQVKSMSPENQQINFKKTEISIEFDEYVKLIKLKDELIVSPPIKYRLETEIKGKRLNINIKDTLKENTTYVLNFGNAIVDNTENNPISNFQYVFSTGDKIDTLKLEGRVLDAYENKAEKQILVMLYDQFEDSLPYKQLPNYIGRTNSSGEFSIRNIKAGKYKVFALEDENSNYLYDRADERIAFDSNLVEVNGQDSENLKLRLFLEDREKQFVSEQKQEGPHLLLQFNKPFDSMYVAIIDSSMKSKMLQIEFGHERDSIDIWFNELAEHKLKLVLSDSLEFNDTVKVEIDSIKIPFKVAFPPRYNYFQTPQIRFNTPIKEWNVDSLLLWDADSNLLPFEIIKTNRSKAVRLQFELKSGGQYYLLALPNAFTDIYGRSNDSLSQSMLFNEAEDFGNLSVIFEQDLKEDLLILLLNEKGEKLRQLKLQNNRVDFLHLKGGKYRLKLIVDSNANGKWDTGNYLEKLMPERTILFDELITIRANWDKEINWKIE